MDIICISSIDWDFIWQGHQEIMSRLARRGHRVLFIENTGVRPPRLKDIRRIKKRIVNWFSGVKGFRQIEDNLVVYAPIIFPFPYSRFFRWVNRVLLIRSIERWMRVMFYTKPVIWTFLPTGTALDLINNIPHRLVIYYCIDSFQSSSYSAKKILRTEIELIRSVDLIFVTSDNLFEHCRDILADNNKSMSITDRLYKFPFGVNIRQFARVNAGYTDRPKELANIDRPIIGYVGGVHKWIDLELILYLSKGHPGATFVFLGPIQTDISILRRTPNILFLGKRPHSELAYYIKFFDVGIIPYRITDYTLNVYPTKLNEYLAMAKPVVSTALPEVIGFNRVNQGMVEIACSQQEFSQKLSKAVRDDSEGLKRRRIEVAQSNDWEIRIGEMSEIVERTLREKKEQYAWQNVLMRIYKRAKYHTMRIGLFFFILWLILFRSNLIWWLAIPLRYTDVLRKADAIVVFGGGVGETGSPGKSTIERARYASQLYKEGYAQRIVFSSGYTYHYNDAQNMRLFALSMGVRDKDIFLERYANSAYDNVRYSLNIIRQNRWDRVIVVSSPYNMRRIKMVFDYLAPDIEVIYSPVPEPQFYAQRALLRWEQIKAILHEYLGILYYRYWYGVPLFL